MNDGYPQYAAYLLGAQSTMIADIQTGVNGVKTDVASVSAKIDERTPRIIRGADINQATTVQNQWYTVLDTLYAKGCLSRVEATYGGVVDNSVIEIEVTADGLVHVLDVTSIITTRGLNGAGGTGSLTRNGVLSWIGEIKFLSFLKVRVRHTHAGTASLMASVDFGLV